MRKKTPPESHVVTRGISLSPDLSEFARKRAAGMDLNVSQYIRRLITTDRERSAPGCNSCKGEA